MQLYAITDRRLFATPEELIEQAALWANRGVDYVQIREKDLAPADLAALTLGIVSAVRAAGGRTRVLLNGPAEVAAATGCDGIHLTAGLPGSAIADARRAMSGVVDNPVVSVSCHTLAEVECARDGSATVAVFAPVFEKKLGEKKLGEEKSGSQIVPGQGLSALAQACRVAGAMPVFGLGGVTAANAQDCLDAGAAGIAAIRLFASGEWLQL